ncbi:Cupin 2 conserved barrel domain protein [Denitrovibrio acetiphilus DSM 12809]|uniref:Cupin 2 conserved barrel domain protein n=1 Tax=Denitrovibrio acetiphilus (strain DSM 12809 / NBRC 114555 / N2460) TaxID=522772 RepID=D4H6X5_DENA2|nr:cupin domain-containing protein [Denitrovibrio acetiphilus]ADD67841.1 Cupin 2 conserved barrel domain protein [Denitrovibrio acetiphilus DSM 12809]
MKNDLPIPDISRLFIGARNEFEVETVFAKEGAVSPDEAHEYDEILVLLEGEIELQLGEKVENLTGLAMKEIPAGTRHVIRSKTTPVKIVIIHPDRLNEGK